MTRKYKRNQPITKYKTKRDSSPSNWLKYELNISNCAALLQNVATNGADTLKSPYLDPLLKHFNKAKLTPKKKVLELRYLLTKVYTKSSAASVVGDEELVVIDDAPLVVVGNVASVVGELDVDCIYYGDDEGD